MSQTITLSLSNRDVDVIRIALRTEHTNHLRNDFRALAKENEELRSRIIDATIESLKDSQIDKNLSIA
jgi:uncharacterized protein YigA (DUF484 family)